jgi:glycosyltransferase involved in cell wall biosynthesis
MSRILYLAADVVPSPKGAGVRIERTVTTLGELGHEIALCTIGSGPGLAGFEHHVVDAPEENFLERMLHFRRASQAWLERQRGDLVQVRGIWEGIPAVAWARARGARLVVEAHGFPSIELPYHYPTLARSPELLEKLVLEESALLHEAELVITHSLTGRRYLLARGVRAERIAIVANAVDAERFSPPPAPPPDAPPYRLVYVGTLSPWQGLPPLIEALARHRGAPLELRVVGPAKPLWRRQLRVLARRSRVHHLLQVAGAVSQAELVPLLQGAHVCLAPLPADARNVVQGCCPIKILEYMAVGRPILATRVEPVEELLEHDRSARLVQPGSPLALADGIAWILAHSTEREALGRAARAQVLARFTVPRFRVALAQALARLG